MKNLKHRLMTIIEYTEEFYKVDIASGHVEDTSKRDFRYINGLGFEIQDEMSLLSLKTIEEAYQFGLKVEEELARKRQWKNHGVSKGRGQ